MGIFKHCTSWNRDVINSKNGFVCKTKQEYIAAIKELLLDTSKIQKYGNQAHQDILDKYNVYVMEKEYRALFKRIALDP